MSKLTFYDTTPFEYGYSSKAELVANMNPLLKELMEQNGFFSQLAKRQLH